jgi:GNAT superfamily N-acetyltransferase
MLPGTVKHISEILISNTLPEHAQQASQTVKVAFGMNPTDTCADSFEAEHFQQHIARFPEGQFVAVMRTEGRKDRVIGVAATMRTNYPPTARPLPWHEMIGDLTISRHNPQGKWLYGVEMAVHPNFRQYGIGTALYEARFELVRQLGLRGWYAVGMLMGYDRYRHLMSVREYGEKVMRRELDDPTVTMQMNRGFRPLAVVEDYMEEEISGNAGVLIVWDNPDTL